MLPLVDCAYMFFRGNLLGVMDMIWWLSLCLLFLSVIFTLPLWFGPDILLWLLLYIVNSFFLPYPWPPQIAWITFLLYYNLLPACYIGVSRSSILGEVSKDWSSWLCRPLSKTGCYWSQSISTFLWVTGKFWCWSEDLGVANSLFHPWCALKQPVVSIS